MNTATDDDTLRCHPIEEVTSIAPHIAGYETVRSDATNYRITNVQKVSWNGRQVLAFTAHQLKSGAFVCLGRFTAPRKTAKRDLWKIAAEAYSEVAL